MSKTILYLVHGTWPFGPFGKESSSSEIRWFRDGSEFSKAITSGMRDDYEIRSFCWSGNNRFADRSEAATNLIHTICMDDAKDEEEYRYVLIAHSHGGTVCANAIAMLSQGEGVHPILDGKHALGRISALVCMSTPFTYWSISDAAHRKAYTFAISSILTAILAIAFIQVFPDHFKSNIIIYTNLFVLTNFLVFIGWTILSVVLPKIRWDYAQSTMFPEAIPIFSLRTPQDEASMAISLAQALQRVAMEFYKLANPQLFVSGIKQLIISWLIVAIPTFFMSVKIAPFIIPGNESDTYIYSVAIIIWSSIAGSIFLACHSLMMASVGFWRFILWRTRSLEVDASPISTWTQVHSLHVSPLDEGVRHFLHERQDVREAIKYLLMGLRERVTKTKDSARLE